ncbi:hypothetical protein B0H13DRAFT_2358947 [Mycena leptocephala]|nr:hypothetical protein B0H13DRAFT_2358947 [Mycena leptocephala]
MSHKRKQAPPQLVVHGTASAVSSCSNDRRRQRTTVGVVAQNAGASAGISSQYWAEDLAANAARLDFTYRLGDNSLESQHDHQFDDGTSLDDGITVVIKEVQYPNSDRPLQTWLPKEDKYLAEQLRREGRGPTWVHSRCAGVKCNDPHRADPHQKCPNHDCAGEAEFRCADQACFGEVMHCARYIVVAHAHLPTHFVERWNGKHFVRKRTWLRDLGLRVQLGHPPGIVCPYRFPVQHDFVLYDLNSVHELHVDFCGCIPEEEDREPRDPEGLPTLPVESRIQLLRACWWPATVAMPNTCTTFAVLRLFQIINCLGKLSAYDFLRGLEMCTNHDGLDKPPDRRKPFMHIVLQWREVKRMKRAMRGHDAGGVKATKQGELALMCRACPQPGWNLPDDWENIDPFYRYIYFLFLVVDANFRLSNQNVSSEAADPVIGDGLGYFCKCEGPDGYKAHIEKNINEQEISNCSGFQAMFLANTKRIKGLRTTGIGGVTCSRHNMWQANGIGDLQVGEHFCNMDFLLLAVLMALNLFWIVVSYNIACQYAINFWHRMAAFPENMRLKIKLENIWWKVPNFHLPPHKKKCHAPYSFHWMWGAGMTHGEGIEQNWSFSNGVAGSTRLMGPGSREATLEDIFGFHNYDRLLAMYRVLPKRLAVSIKEGLKHRAAFEAFSAGLEAARPKEVGEWKASMAEWESKQHVNPTESPFEVGEEVTTLRQIQLDIATEEFICTDDGIEVEQEHSPGAFITMGLELEEVQCRLEAGIPETSDHPAEEDTQFPTNPRQAFDSNGDQPPEATQLFMPSEIQSVALRGKVGSGDALEEVRHGLRTRTLTNRFRLRNYTGQGMMTKGQGILQQINIKIHIAKLRYRYSCSALVMLRGHGDWEERLCVLKDEDVRALTEEEKAQNEHWAELGGAIIEGGIARASGLASGEGSHTLSWIWYTVGVPAGGDDKDPQFYDALRVEWCKAYSRVRRYSEDVRHLCEEMRQTIAFGQTAAALCDARVDEELPDSSPELTEGRHAYAAEHADTERRTCERLEEKWRAILRRADTYLEGGLEAEGDAITVELDIGDELAPEEEEALLEGKDE